MKRTLSTLALALLASACGAGPTGVTEPAARAAYDDGTSMFGSGNRNDGTSMLGSGNVTSSGQTSPTDTTNTVGTQGTNMFGSGG